MEISSDKSKILVKVIKPRTSTNIRMNDKVLGRSGLGNHTNQGWNVIKGSNDETGTGTPSHDKASSTVKKESDQFSYKD